MQMPVIVSMLRGVNLGPSRRIKMEDLREVYESLGLRDVRTYVQSGNVVFRSPRPLSPARVDLHVGVVHHEVVVGNCQWSRHGLRVSPRSFPGDGFLDLLIMTGPKSQAFTVRSRSWYRR